MTAGAGGGPGGRRIASLSLSAVGQRTRAGAVRRRGFPLSRPSAGNTLRTILSPPLSVNAAHKRSSVLAASLSIQHTRVFSLSHVYVNVYVCCVCMCSTIAALKIIRFQRAERRACKCQSTKKHGQSLYRTRACARMHRLAAPSPLCLSPPVTDLGPRISLTPPPASAARKEGPLGIVAEIPPGFRAEQGLYMSQAFVQVAEASNAPTTPFRSGARWDPRKTASFVLGTP